MDERSREVDSGFDTLIGVEWLDDDPAEARARVPVGPQLLQPFGLLHGGVMSTLIESVCSRGTALAVAGEGMMAMGQTIDVSFLRPITDGHAEVRATARHQGRTTWVWDAEVVDAEGRICALGRMTVAVRPSRRSDS